MSPKLLHTVLKAGAQLYQAGHDLSRSLVVCIMHQFKEPTGSILSKPKRDFHNLFADITKLSIIDWYQANIYNNPHQYILVRSL